MYMSEERRSQREERTVRKHRWLAERRLELCIFRKGRRSGLEAAGDVLSLVSRRDWTGTPPRAPTYVRTHHRVLRIKTPIFFYLVLKPQAAGD